MAKIRRFQRRDYNHVCAVGAARFEVSGRTRPRLRLVVDLLMRGDDEATPYIVWPLRPATTRRSARSVSKT